ncbi:histidine-rich glycoprotein [Dasypus novemcinctus]|uniref:histidine-rich glycoprotein n=1 Tax=Dasypus novemcinctus TaxID=9361 RepID=UPI0003288B16|nr:histidine-rich glycoprotein [Dasypus novemcinctus]
MADHSKRWFSHFSKMKVIAAALLLITLQHSCAVSPTDCNAVEPVAGKALDLINKGRRDGYLFQLLRITDAHLDKAESPAVYYLVLDVKESDCSVLSRKHWNECEPAASRRPSDLVIGQCKVIATTRSSASQDLKVNDFNCTTSSVSSALANTKDSPVLFDFFEDTESYRKQANQALEKYKKENDDFASFRVDQVERVARVRGEERTNYYLDFSVRNCSRHHFPRHPNIFGFCRAELSYDVGASDLETPKDLDINCEGFTLEEHRNFSGGQPSLGHPFHSGGHEHSPPDKPPFKPDGARDHHHPHKPHKHGCPLSLEDKDHPGRPPLQEGAPPSGSRCHHTPFGVNGIHGPSRNHSSSEHRPHGHHPHGHHPHGRHPHGHRHHGHRHHGHRHRGHHPHGPCDPPLESEGPHDHHRRGHGPPAEHSEERGPDKGHSPFHWRPIGYVYRLPPLKKGEVLPPPEANFPSFSLPHQHKPLQPEIQPFPQSPSESCPGKFKNEFPQLLTFFANIFPK